MKQKLGYVLLSSTLPLIISPTFMQFITSLIVALILLLIEMGINYWMNKKGAKAKEKLIKLSELWERGNEWFDTVNENIVWESFFDALTSDV